MCACSVPRGLRGADTGRVVQLKTGIAHKKDESRGDQATCEKKAAQRWCWYLSVIGALLILAKLQASYTSHSERVLMKSFTVLSRIWLQNLTMEVTLYFPSLNLLL